MSAAPPRATAHLELDGRPVALPMGGVVRIGRDPQAHVVLEDRGASWHHAELRLDEGGWILRDVGSSNGTRVRGQRIDERGVLLQAGDVVQIGAHALVYRPSAPAGAGAPPVAPPPRPPGPPQQRSATVPPPGPPGAPQQGPPPPGPQQEATTFGQVPDTPATRPHGAVGRTTQSFPVDRPLRIGRAPDNDIVLDEPNVSRQHAVVQPGSPPIIKDVGSRNGVRAGNQFVRQAVLAPGVAVGIGPYELVFDGTAVTAVDTRRAGLALRAEHVSVAIGPKTILYPTSLQVRPGELIALIGQSGSGKTTLLKAMAGIRPPSTGQALLNGEPVALRQTDIGYVPQAETVHGELTVREALRHTAELRLPSDTRPEELERAVEEALLALGLEQHGNTRIGSLSGGQRKRTAVASELIGQPTMLFLDEPTSGLDPGLERRLMQLLRSLADAGRGVVVVTHATASLELCDTVAIMAVGGHLRHLGSPDQTLKEFGVRHFDEVYSALEREPPIQVHPGQIPPAPQGRTPKSGTRFVAGRSFLRHFPVLTVRYSRTFLRDRKTLLVLFGQVPIIALCIALLFPGGLFERPDLEPGKSAQLLFLAVTAAIWVGLITACREVVKERDIAARELNVGVRLDAYIASKLVVLFTATALQVVILFVVTFTLQPLNGGLDDYVGVFMILIVCAWTSAALGLAVSTLARSVDQATSYVPLLLIPQLLFAGALVPVADMRLGPEIISIATFARWAFQGSGEAAELNTRFAEDAQYAAANPYGPSFFDVDVLAASLILVGFIAAFTLLAGIMCARRVAVQN